MNDPQPRHNHDICRACGQYVPPKVGPLLCSDCERGEGRETLATVYGRDGRALCSRHGYREFSTQAWAS
jgi:hypothetical protein